MQQLYYHINQYIKVSKEDFDEISSFFEIKSIKKKKLYIVQAVII
ncbi:hypothetical protein JCM19275_1320 [Nonlabens ulvanivorans]|uniref:Uncharacterized protein n=1 Tax=Nonlabens ulvanivorans TaxID=906888 RepID=A0A090WHY7_NONUL|nr:hypothetical protein JCM19275_1320 [Nonlabens ulvanivorans]